MQGCHSGSQGGDDVISMVGLVIIGIEIMQRDLTVGVLYLPAHHGAFIHFSQNVIRRDAPHLQ
jgi:hypothetical protein